MYNLGDDSEIDLSTYVLSDNAWVEMAENYPMFETKVASHVQGTAFVVG